MFRPWNRLDGKIAKDRNFHDWEPVYISEIWKNEGRRGLYNLACGWPCMLVFFSLCTGAGTGVSGDRLVESIADVVLNLFLLVVGYIAVSTMRREVLTAAMPLLIPLGLIGVVFGWGLNYMFGMTNHLPLVACFVGLAAMIGFASHKAWKSRKAATAPPEE